MRHIKFIKLFVLIFFVAGGAAILVTNNSINQPAAAFSSGPPASFSGAPGEFRCDECHVFDGAPSGAIMLGAPSSYVPGQTYQMTVTVSNNHPSRRRWGFQLTAVDDSGERAGTLESLGDGLTQVIMGTVSGAVRQYVEHTSAGTFDGQQNSATWTFRWIAPATDIGPVTFYAAGNGANGNNNSDGDSINFTFVSALPATTAGDYTLNVAPASRTVAPGESATYTVTVTPTGGFTGTVNLSATGLPANASASFNPASVNITSAAAQTSMLTVTTAANTPVGASTLNVTGTSGALQRTANATLTVQTNQTIDLALQQSVSPNPGLVGVGLAFRFTVTNNSTTMATNVMLTDALPSGVTFVSTATTQGSCSGTATVTCNLGTLAANASAIVTISATPSATGQLVNSATVRATEADANTSNNTASVNVRVDASSTTPVMLDPNLTVRAVVGGLNQPTTMAFIGANDFFVLEKATGRVQRITNGVLQPTPVLDLAVNGASERGLLGIALHPNFPTDPRVYLYWTESSTGADTTNTDEITLLGNRVDAFTWNGTTLTQGANVIRLRALQADANQPSRGNHNGGIIRFSPDGKLYIIIGDLGRRGFLQNLRFGPSVSPDGPIVQDDQFGGPEPDDEHLSGAILRLNDDGSTPTDNPFFNINSGLTGEAAANVKKLYAYGIRNSFGMAFDPISGYLWTQENGDDAFDEINRIVPGFNGGWIQLMGPMNRIAEFKAIELSRTGGLQQVRWPPEHIADTPAEALARLYLLPGARHTDPEFSWRYALAPSPIGFVRGRALGPQFDGDLFVGASRINLSNGFLFRFDLTSDRRQLSFTDARLHDKVADNNDKFDLTESESLLIGRDFGITTDIQTGPSGSLYVVSLSNGAIYEITSKPNTIQFSASNYQASETDVTATVTVSRTGDTSGTAAIDYQTVDNPAEVRCDNTMTAPGVAFARCDYATNVDTLTFAPGEVSKTFTVSIINDAHAEPNETVSLRLFNPSGASLGTQSTATLTITDNDAAGQSNPIFASPFFVRQQYLDFLSREPEEAGFNAWLSVLNNCPNVFNDDPNSPSAQCDRIIVSSSFFRSQEFQLKGYFVYLFYKATLGRLPLYTEIIPDMRSVTGATSEELFAKRDAFARTWVNRPEFAARYPGTLADAAFVDSILTTAGVQLTTPDPVSGVTRNSLVADLQRRAKTRAEVVRLIVESHEVDAREFNGAFVAMQYFGYLRRDPESGGYQEWLNHLNANPMDFRTMVNGFMNSIEYRLRFGTP
ncbi:MAG: PQQ-dependent sugar dehydrogenase [Acidobacteriota bacterium]|nr:PQQ-dependent sugar dehydrogenase [Acidobacteriota bacterium]